MNIIQIKKYFSIMAFYYNEMIMNCNVKKNILIINGLYSSYVFELI